jgi:hypothetical protein
LVGHPAKEESIGLGEVLDRVTMQVFVRQDCTMIATPVQCDVDGIPQGSHGERVPTMAWTGIAATCLRWRFEAYVSPSKSKAAIARRLWAKIALRLA